MRRVLLFLITLFCAGTICGLFIRVHPYFFIPALLLLLILAFLRYINGRKIFCLIYLIIFLCGAFYSSEKIFEFQSTAKDFIGQNAIIEGQISQDIGRKENTSQFTLYAKNIKLNDKVYTGHYKIRIVDYKNDKGYIVPYNFVILSGKFDEYSQYKNIGMFSFDRYLLKEGICGTLNVDRISGIKSYECKDRYMQKTIYSCRVKIEKLLGSYVNDNSLQVLKGILFGDTSHIEEDVYDSFQKVGIVHVFAVSGYNIWLLFYILNGALFFIRHCKRLKIFIVIFFLGLYTIMAGAEPSVVRAFIMASVILVGRVLNRDSDPLTSLAAAAFVILLFNPFDIMDIGFQLSFIAAASIILLYPAMKRIKLPIHYGLKDSIMLPLSVQIGIMPIIMYYFNSIAVLSVISNILIVPLISIITISSLHIPIFNFIWRDLAFTAGSIIDSMVIVISNMTSFIASIPYSNLNVVSPRIWEIALYYLGLAYVFKYIKIKAKYNAVIVYSVVTILFCYTLISSIPSDLKISFIDVGQGDSILITTPDRKYILIDGGGKPKSQYSSFDIGENILKPYLYKHGVKKIDMIVSTHSHEDHLNGLIPVMKSFNIGAFVIGNKGGYDKLLSDEVLLSPKTVEVYKGDAIQAGKYVKLYVLNSDEYGNGENDSSIVIKLQYKEFSALFTGDISSDVEKKLIKYDIACDVLKVPHHGSATSLDEDFLDYVNPQAAVICVGKNSFGHPSDTIITRLKERGITIYRTDRDGEVVITTRGRGFKVKTAM